MGMMAELFTVVGIPAPLLLNDAILNARVEKSE